MHHHRPERPLSRRLFLGAGGGGAALTTMSLSGCGFFSTEAPTSTTASGGASQADLSVKESPALTKKVQAGDLPALEERIPQEPLVVQVAEPGDYGGTFKSVTLGPGDEPAFGRIADYQPLLRKNPMLTENEPNIATEIASDDGRVFTIKLRAGMRWSDGEPFTADDLMFAFDDWYADTEVHPTPPGYLSSDTTMAKAEKISDTEVKITFPKPNGFFVEFSTRYKDLINFPKHYLSQFMPKYNDKAEKIAKEKDYESWIDYFNAKNNLWENPERPSLLAWLVTTPLGEGTRVEMERNPYFFKTDQHGRQLPYIDKLSWEVVLDPEVMVLKAADGELDMIYRHVNTAANKPVFAKNREDGEFDFVEFKSTYMNTMCVALNLCNKDKAKRALYQNRDFRIGLSHAIDRQEMIVGAWQRQGEPWQCAPAKESIFYDEEFAKQYTEYDPELAEEHLDKAGITERDNKGFRKLPNGKLLTVTVDIPAALSDEWPAAMDMIRSMWQKVGVRTQVNTIDRTLFYDRKTADANQHDAGVWLGDGGLIVEIQEPRWYMPWNDESIWATPWAQWFNSRGEAGMEPPPPVQQQFDHYRELRATPDPDARDEIFRKILAIAKEEFFVIGIGSTAAPFYLVSNRLTAPVEGIPDTALFSTPAHANTEGWSISENA